MKKILALVLTLAMMLTMFNLGFVASAADEIPTGDHVQAISNAGQLADLENLVNSGKTYFYLTTDITLGSESEEAGLITIPAGVTLDGNGNTIYQGFYTAEPGWYAPNNPFAHSNAWTHEMFVLNGANITIKNVNFGSTEVPVYLSKSNAKDAGGELASGYTANDGFGMFADVADATVTWSNVNFYVERYGRGLGSYNYGALMFKSNGVHAFTDCTMNVSVMSAGSQYGGWFYSSNVTTFTNCANNSFTVDSGYNFTTDPDTQEQIVDYNSPLSYTGEFWGSVGGGFIHTAYGNTTMYNCVNNVDITASYSGTGYKFAGFVAEQNKGNVYLENCVNYGDFSLNAITIGGSIVGRGQNGLNDKFQLINCVNYGNITRSSGTGMTSNHGFGGITGHVSANSVFEVVGCVNYGNVQGAGNVGGIVGLVEGTAAVKLIENCTNFGNITAKQTAVEIAGIVAQPRTGTINILGCKNYGSVNAPANKLNAGILGKAYTAGATYNLTNCENYGYISNKQYSAGMVAETAAATVNITACANYGEVAGVHAVSGFVGQVPNNANAIITINNSLNAGYIHEGPAAGEGIGGFFGRVAGTNPVIELNNCANIGKIAGSTKYTAANGVFGDTFGQFIGGYTVTAGAYGANSTYPLNKVFFATWTNTPELNNCYAYGTAVPADGAMSAAGWVTGSYDEEAGKYVGLAAANYSITNIPVTEAPNHGIAGINVEYTGTVDYETPTVSNLNDLATALGVEFMLGADGEDAIVVATPAIRGYQVSTDGTALRLVSAINSVNYTNVGYTYSATFNGQEIATNKEVTVDYVLENICANGESGLKTYAASDFAAKYLMAITFNGIDVEGTLVITVTPTADDYEGTAVTLTIVNGEVQ